MVEGKLGSFYLVKGKKKIGGGGQVRKSECCTTQLNQKPECVITQPLPDSFMRNVSFIFLYAQVYELLQEFVSKFIN